jgi:hypothetical protein
MADSKVVFLCWSGTRSRKVAEALDRAIRKLECGLVPMRSPEIAKGRIWFQEVRQALNDAEAAIVCLTPENAAHPWIHFEAGVIAAKVGPGAGGSDLPVYPYLFRMNGAELAGPLAQLQGTVATREDTLRLIRGLMGEAHWNQWRPQADAWWEALEQELHAAEDRPLEEILPDLASLFRRKTFDEPLDECMNQTWPARWGGARDTWKRLQDKVDEVASQCRPYTRDLLNQLVEAVDGYAMAMEPLLAPLTFGLRPDGKRDIPPGLLAACERRRNEIRDLISGLADPQQAPVFEDAPRFQRMGFPERKEVVHRFEAWLDRSGPEASRDWRLAQAAKSQAARTSRWDFDRIAFYLCSERGSPALAIAADWLRVELEKA